VLPGPKDTHKVKKLEDAGANEYAFTSATRGRRPTITLPRNLIPAAELDMVSEEAIYIHPFDHREISEGECGHHQRSGKAVPRLGRNFPANTTGGKWY